jgi:hypothetical protein
MTDFANHAVRRKRALAVRWATPLKHRTAQFAHPPESEKAKPRKPWVAIRPEGIAHGTRATIKLSPER